MEANTLKDFKTELRKNRLIVDDLCENAFGFKASTMLRVIIQKNLQEACREERIDSER